jgi:hypothetical protein
MVTSAPLKLINAYLSFLYAISSFYCDSSIQTHTNSRFQALIKIVKCILNFSQLKMTTGKGKKIPTCLQHATHHFQTDATFSKKQMGIMQ